MQTAFYLRAPAAQVLEWEGRPSLSIRREFKVARCASRRTCIAYVWHPANESSPTSVHEIGLRSPCDSHGWTSFSQNPSTLHRAFCDSCGSRGKPG